MSVSQIELAQMQSLPLDMKIRKTVARLSEFYDYYNGDIAVSVSGGIDSRVLFDIARKAYPNIPAVFSNTGVEFKAIVNFVKTLDGVDVVRPEHSFNWVTKNYGWPVVSKKISRFISDCQNPTERNVNVRQLRLTGISQKTNPGKVMNSFKIPKKWLYLIDAPFKISDKCCEVLKKKPLDKYRKETGYKTVTAEMAVESEMREKTYLRTGCNNFHESNPKSMPMGFWTRQDVLEYITVFKISYCKEKYGDILRDPVSNLLFNTGEQRTGCYVCPFGSHLEKCPNRYQRMEGTTEYKVCENLGVWPILDYINVPHSAAQMNKQSIRYTE
jgi:3'-phosphoadenosine 5'-phosphosulfate sulfotransferase (PAPS reductase)/FAD synthetase